MQKYDRIENVTIDRTFIGFGMCGPEITLHLKGDGSDVPMTVFWGTQNVDSLKDVVSAILSVAGAKSWEHLRGKQVRALMQLGARSGACSAYVCDGIQEILGDNYFSVREQFERTWQLSCEREFSSSLGIRDKVKSDQYTVNAKIVGTFLGVDEQGFRVAVHLKNESEKLDARLELRFDEASRIDSAIASLRSVARAAAWENLHGQLVRAIIDYRGKVVGIGHLIDRAFFTAFAFQCDSVQKKAA